MTGFGPTAVGYFVQGGAKFAGYEFWKKQFVALAGDKETAVRYRTAIYLGAASVGEFVFFLSFCSLNLLKFVVALISVIWSRARASIRFFADVLLTPLEATRIRMVSQRGYATGLVSGFTRLLREGGVRDLYAGFIPILFK